MEIMNFEDAFKPTTTEPDESGNISKQTEPLTNAPKVNDSDILASFDSAFSVEKEAINPVDDKIDKTDAAEVAAKKALTSDEQAITASFDSAFLTVPMQDGEEESILRRALKGRTFDSATLARVKKSLGQKLEGDKLLGALATPTGQYYVTLGKLIPASEDLLKAVGMKEKINIDPKIKYGPVIAQNLEIISKIAGVPTPELPDRFIIGAFLDSLIGIGAPKVLNKLTVNKVLHSGSAAEIEKNILQWIKSDPEKLREYERVLSKIEWNAASKNAAGWRPLEKSGVTREIADKMLETTGKKTRTFDYAGQRYLKTGKKWKVFDLSEGLQQATDNTQILKGLKDLGKDVQPKLIGAALAQKEAKKTTKVVDETQKMFKDLANGMAEIASKDKQSIVFSGIKYTEQAGKWRAIKLSDGLEKTAYSKEVIAAYDALKDGEVLLPAPGVEDLSVIQKIGKGISSVVTSAREAFTHAIGSPQHIVPELYDLHRKKMGWISNFKLKYAARLQPFAAIQKDTQRASRIAEYLNGDLTAEKAMLSPEDVQIATAFRESWDELADVIYSVTKDPKLAPGQRIVNYYTHVVENIKGGLLNIKELNSFAFDEVVAGAEKLRGTGKGFLKERKGADEFSKNPFKAFETYLNWASEHLADTRLKPTWEKLLKLYPKAQSDYGFWYWKNLHGMTSVSKTIQKAEQGVRQNIYNATLGWNLGASLVNRTQPFVLGALRMGSDNPLYAGLPNFSPMINGHKLLHLAQLETKEGRRIREILRTSTVLDEMSEFLTGESVFANIKDPKLFKQNLSSLIKDPLMMFQRSEAINKSTMYLGAYDDIITKIHRVKDANPARVKNTIAYLQKLGVDLTKSAEEQAHKVALKFTMDTQLDMSRAGQNMLASLPIVGSLMMYTSYPLKAGEMISRVGINASKKLYKAAITRDASVFLDNDVQGLIRFGISTAVGTIIAKSAGISEEQLLGLGNYIPNLSPISKMSIRALSTASALANNLSAIGHGDDVDVFSPGFSDESYLGKRGVNNFLRDASYAFGIPGAAQAWKISAFTKILLDNMDNESPDGKWNVFDDKGTLMYRTSPIHALSGLFFPSADKAQYYEAVRTSMAEEQKRKSLSNEWLAAKRAGNMTKAGDLSAQLVEEFGTRPRESAAQRRATKLTFEEREARKKRRAHRGGK